MGILFCPSNKGLHLSISFGFTQKTFYMIYLTDKFNIDCNLPFGDKSISHRALIMASIADKESVIYNVSLCKDVLSTAKCLQTLGAKIDFYGTTARVCPINEPSTDVILDCGNSGTTARLLAGVVAGLGITATFVGDAQLSRRPMDRVLQPLAKLGAKFDKPSGSLFRLLPSKLSGTNLTCDVASAQVKSAVLLAGLFADGETCFSEEILTRDHTERLLRLCGADIFCDDGNVSVSRSRPDAFCIRIPNDVSSVAYLFALALLKGKKAVAKNVSTNQRRIGFFRLLQKAGVRLSIAAVKPSCGESVGRVTLYPSDNLTGFCSSVQETADAIDEIPLLCCIACAIGGKFVFDGVSDLANKESNRLASIDGLVSSLGQSCKLCSGKLIIESDGVLPKQPRFKSFGDHRIAMCAAVMSIVCGGGFVDDVSSVDISFPQFWQCLGVNPMRFGLVGSNVSYTLSPLLITHLASKRNICCNYDVAEMSPDVSDEELLSKVFSLDGLNVTIPFKERMAKLLCSDLPSVNTIGKGVKTTSTDGYGLLKTLSANDFPYKNSPLWIIGAGGAAQACVDALYACGARMQIFNRTQSRADELSAKYRLGKVDNPVGILVFTPPCDYLDRFDIPSSVKYVFSASYSQDNVLVQKAKSLGISTADGLQMLYHQGAKSFSLWTDTAVQDDFSDFEQLVSEQNRK